MFVQILNLCPVKLLFFLFNFIFVNFCNLLFQNENFDFVFSNFWVQNCSMLSKMLAAVKSQWGVLVEVEFWLTKFEEVNMKTTNCAYLDIASSSLLNELRSLKEMETISTLKNPYFENDIQEQMPWKLTVLLSPSAEWYHSSRVYYLPWVKQLVKIASLPWSLWFEIGCAIAKTV